MKKIFYVAALAIGLASCEKEEAAPVEKNLCENRRCGQVMAKTIEIESVTWEWQTATPQNPNETSQNPPTEGGSSEMTVWLVTVANCWSSNLKTFRVSESEWENLQLFEEYCPEYGEAAQW